MAGRTIPIQIKVDGREAQRGTDQATSSLNNLKRRADETSRSTSTFQQRLNRLGSAAQRVGSSVTSLKGALVGLGGALATRQLVRFTQQALSTAESLSDVSQQTGIAAERLQGLRRAFDQNGGSAQQLDSALSRFNRRVGLAASDTGAASEAVKRFGVSLRDAQGNVRNTGAVLNDVIGVIQGIESSSERAAVASRFFGEEAGPKLAPLLAQGQKSIGQYTEQLREAGVLFRDDLVASAGQASASLRRFSGDVSQAFQIGLLERFVSETGSVENSLKSLRTSARRFGEAAGGALQVAASAAKALADNLDLAITVLSATAVGRGLRIFGKLTQVIGAAATAAFTYQERVGGAQTASDGLRAASQRLSSVLGNEATAQGEAAEAARDKAQAQLESAKATLAQLEAQRQLNETVTEGAQRPGLNVAREQGEQVSELRSVIEGLEERLASAGDSADQTAASVSGLNDVLSFSETVFKDTGDAASNTGGQVNTLKDRVDNLRDSLDPAGAAISSYRQDADLLREALDEGVISGEQFNRALGLLNQRFAENSSAARDVERSTDSITDATRDATDATQRFGIEAESTAEIVTGAMEDAGRSAQREFTA